MLELGDRLRTEPAPPPGAAAAAAEGSTGTESSPWTQAEAQSFRDAAAAGSVAAGGAAGGAARLHWLDGNGVIATALKQQLDYKARLDYNGWMTTTGYNDVKYNDWINMTGLQRLDRNDWITTTGLKMTGLQRLSATTGLHRSNNLLKS